VRKFGSCSDRRTGLRAQGQCQMYGTSTVSPGDCQRTLLGCTPGFGVCACPSHSGDKTISPAAQSRSAGVPCRTAQVIDAWVSQWRARVRCRGMGAPRPSWLWVGRRNRNLDPPTRFVELHRVHFLYIVEGGARTDGNIRRCIRLVQFIVGVYFNLLHPGLLVELYIDQVWLRAIRPAHQQTTLLAFQRARRRKAPGAYCQ
jgi:hypothetical protein